jgi:dTDP-4-amino-4,6-dideoxygalactose transaminase
MSEIVAAVVREQLRGYPKHLASLRSAVAEFCAYIERFEGVRVVRGKAVDHSQPAFTQLVIALDGAPEKHGTKSRMWDELTKRGVHVWHANFELINSLSLFRLGIWRKWLLRGDLPKLQQNYAGQYPNAKRVFENLGMGLGKMNFLSPENIKHLKKSFEAIFRRSYK